MKKKFKSVFLSAFLAAGLAGPASCAAVSETPQRPDIRPPFNVEKIRAQKGRPDDRPFKCSKPPEAVVDLVFDTFYEKDDKSASIVDKKALKVYQKSVQPLSAYEAGLSQMANRYVRSNPAREDIAKCALHWLERWAKEDALLGGDVTKNGEFVRKWALASLASAYLQIQDDPTLEAKRKKRVEGWLRRVAETVMGDYSRNTELRSRQNNHLYWAAWSVALAAAILDDRLMLEWALDRGRFGIDEIQPNGTLQLELDRKGKALHYHAFAAGPLVYLAEIGAANGATDLYTRNDHGLSRLATRVLSGMEDPTWFARKTGTPQNLTRSVTSQNLGWVVPYAARFPSSGAESWIKMLTPVIQRRTGGDNLLLYGKKGGSDAPSPESYASETDTDAPEP